MVEYEENKQFQNWSESVDGEPARTYRPRSTGEVVELVRTAQREGKRVRAVGSGWSFADVMYTDDFLVDTTRLKGIFAFSQGRHSWGAMNDDGAPDRERSTVLTECLREEVKNSDRRFVHLRAGTKLSELVRQLDSTSRGSPARGRWALPTMGGASGQTVAGAFSTGTHGGDFDLPPMADMVRALLVVGPDGVPYWVERSGEGALTRPEAMRSTPRMRDVRLKYDDAWFEALLVAVGNLGIIVEYVLEVREQFGISERSVPVTWDDLAPMLRSGELFNSTRYSARDPSRRWIDAHPSAPDRRPVGVSVFINPYRRSDDYAARSNADRDVVLTTHASSSDFQGAHRGPEGLSDLEIMHLIGDLQSTDDLGTCRRILGEVLGSLRDPSGTGGYRVAHSVLDTTTSEGRRPVLSLEICVSTAENRHVDLIERLFALFDAKMQRDWPRGRQTKFAGGLNLRFTQPTSAMMGMQAPLPGVDEQRFCHIEVIAMRQQWVTGRPWGVDYRDNDMESHTEELTDAFERVAHAYDARLHWGQMSRTRRHDPDLYPRFGSWLQVKRQLTNEGAIRTFETAFSKRHLNLQYDVAIKAPSGRYFVAEAGGGREVLANRERRGIWETFKMIHLGDARVAFRSYGGPYLTADGEGLAPLRATAKEIGKSESFELVELDGARFALRTAHGRFVVAEGGGGGAVNANRPHARSWETFEIEGHPQPMNLFLNPEVMRALVGRHGLVQG